jgi:hypothetical protein
MSAGLTVLTKHRYFLEGLSLSLEIDWAACVAKVHGRSGN